MPGSQQLNCSFNVTTGVDECSPGILSSKPHHSQLLDLWIGIQDIILQYIDNLHNHKIDEVLFVDNCTRNLSCRRFDKFLVQLSTRRTLSFLWLQEQLRTLYIHTIYILLNFVHCTTGYTSVTCGQKCLVCEVTRIIIREISVYHKKWYYTPGEVWWKFLHLKLCEISTFLFYDVGKRWYIH